MPGRHLRIVAVLDGPAVPAWVFRVLADVSSAGHAELAGVVFAPAEARAQRSRARAFEAYRALDRRLFPLPNDPLAPVDAAPLLERCTLLATPAEAKPDVVLKLASSAAPPEWLRTAPLGVWSFDHDELALRGGAPLFWEMAHGLPVIDLCLRAHTAGGSRALARSTSATHATSLLRCRHAALWKAATLVKRALRDAALETGPGGDVEKRAPALPERAPTAFEVARWMGRIALRVGRDRLLRRTQSEAWFVALRRSRDSLVDGPMEGFVPVPMPGDRFYADPFLVPDGERLWLFFEDADRVSGKGVIRCSEVRTDGSLGESHVVLERDTHLSYPNVFRAGDAWFMLPETYENRSIELWRAVEFPWRWKLDKVLLHDVMAVDPTLLEHGGRLWIFAGVGVAEAVQPDELFAFSADSLRGEWRPHPRNPIVSDVQHTRPAGQFFREGGRLYRPAQDGSGTYGAAFWIHRVDRLDEHVYEETPVRHVGTSWHPGLIGTHTIQRAGGFDAIDGRLWLRRGQAFPG